MKKAGRCMSRFLDFRGERIQMAMRLIAARSALE
jgi:hypothetical protein